MKIIIVPDSFKGSLSAGEICDIVSEEILRLHPGTRIVTIPAADGGEGTVDSVVSASGGSYAFAYAKDPLRRDIEAKYGIIGDAAVIECAAASGLGLVNDEERDVMSQNSYGTGMIILDAIKHGFKDIYIGLGGSATNDGGMGFLAALGAKFYDENGCELEPIPKNLSRVSAADFRGLKIGSGGDVSTGHEAECGGSEKECGGSEAEQRDPVLTLTIMSDVENPLLGPEGATMVFGPQKGAPPELLDELDDAMKHYADVIETAIGKSIRDIPGAGAAGGLGFAVMVLAAARGIGFEARAGIDVVLDLTGFDKELYDADMVITGEGRADYQSAYGKVVAGVAKRCKNKNGHADIPCVVITGKKGDGADSLYELGVSEIIEIGAGYTTEESIARAEELLRIAVSKRFDTLS